MRQPLEGERREQHRERAGAAHPAEHDPLGGDRGDDRGERRSPAPAATTRAPRVGQEVGDVGADGDQLGVGEVDEVHHAEDQRDAEGEQGVRAAAPDAVDERSGTSVASRRAPSPPTKCPNRSSWAASSGPGALDGDPPGAQHVAAVGDLEGPPGVLLDDEHRAALRAQLDEQVEHDVDHDRRQPERRLVEQHEPRVAHQRPGHGELLGLAARQVAGRACTTGRRAPGTAARASSSRRRRSAGARRDAGQLQVLADGQVAEDPPVLGHERQPGAHEAGRLGAGDVDAVEQHAPAGRAGAARRPCSSSVVLPAPLGPTRATSSPASTCERHVVEGDDGAVARRQPLDASIESGQRRDVRRAERLGERRLAVVDGEDDDVLLRDAVRAGVGDRAPS